MKRVTKSVLPVAGFETRVFLATTTPKENLTIVDLPALQYVADKAIDVVMTFVRSHGDILKEGHAHTSAHRAQFRVSS